MPQVTPEEKAALLQPIEEPLNLSGQFFIPQIVDNIEQLVSAQSPNLITYLTLLERRLTPDEKTQVQSAIRGTQNA